MIKVFKRKLKALLTLLFICSFASSVQANLIELKDPNKGADNFKQWIMDDGLPATETARIDFDTTFPGEYALSPVYNVAYMNFATFDFKIRADVNNPDPTRWLKVFYRFDTTNEQGWELLEKITHKQAPTSWEDISYSVDTSGFSTIQLKFSSERNGSTGSKARDISVKRFRATAVPAPHTLAIFGFGIFLLVARLRKTYP